MTSHVHTTTQFGRLVVAAFDEAARYGNDPREVSRLAVKAIAHMLESTRGSSHASLLRVASPRRSSISLVTGRR